MAKKKTKQTTKLSAEEKAAKSLNIPKESLYIINIANM